ncbi:hypothetical protein O7626_13960 [Micromonospora sp. WMMD1102]|uniref:hypothetical protein n=1 Tax=Micromonospora sp. WMMD1102 TaxID=3016105 RepID=UPI002414D5D1|nr:hypothetical protein [Micromonospora sp. WMMD1102]MDG4787022.1 hypothetical protein [Micromonospora sp. WMMD1102]
MSARRGGHQQPRNACRNFATWLFVRADNFQPCGELTDDQLAAAENLAAFR